MVPFEAGALQTPQDVPIDNAKHPIVLLLVERVFRVVVRQVDLVACMDASAVRTAPHAEPLVAEGTDVGAHRGHLAFAVRRRGGHGPTGWVGTEVAPPLISHRRHGRVERRPHQRAIGRGTCVDDAHLARTTATFAILSWQRGINGLDPIALCYGAALQA